MDSTFASRFALEILIVDDHMINQRVVSSLLRRLGYNPQVVDRGWKAIESVRRSTFDLILMDVQMPEMNGLQAAAEVRRISEQKIQIVAMTALSLDQLLALGDLSMLDGYLQKPVTLKGLIPYLKRGRKPRPPAPEAKQTEEKTLISWSPKTEQ